MAWHKLMYIVTLIIARAARRFHDANLYFYCMATVIVLNADGGPFNSTRWYQSIKEAAQEYIKVACSADPIFSGLVNLIRDDKFGTDLGASNDVSDDELFHSLASEFDTRTKKFP